MFRDPLTNVTSVKDEIATELDLRLEELEKHREWLLEQVNKGRTFGAQLQDNDTRISEVLYLADRLGIHLA